MSTIPGRATSSVRARPVRVTRSRRIADLSLPYCPDPGQRLILKVDGGRSPPAARHDGKPAREAGMAHGTDRSSSGQDAGNQPPDGGTGAGLRRELNIWEVIGISVALMAPVHGGEHQPAGHRGERRARRPAGVRARHGRRAARELDLRPALPAVPPLRLGVRLRRRHPRRPRRRRRRLGAARDLHVLRRRHVDRRPASSAPPSWTPSASGTTRRPGRGSSSARSPWPASTCSRSRRCGRARACCSRSRASPSR